MNHKKDHKRKILRQFCSNIYPYHSFTTFEKAEQKLLEATKRAKLEEPVFDIVRCTICGEWHYLRKPMTSKFPHTKEWEIQEEHNYQIILNEPFVEKDFSKKRTIAKRIGRYNHIQPFPKKKYFFGTVPDNGFFDWKVSQRFVCFNCRKSWRRHPRAYQLKCCPDCAGEVRQVYPMFRAPKKNDIKAWQKLERSLMKR